ncbi:MAG: PilC/PilY family type IV pilus protein, partial [Mycobacteriales bacterium]
CNLAVANGLSTAIAVNSSGQSSAAANVVYAGDLQGNLWRIDISNVNPALWTVSVLLQARDLLGNAQPITTAPVATLNPKYPQLLGNFVFVGTGQLLGIPDLSNINLQTIYGVYDPPAPYSSPLVRANLVQQTLSSAVIGVTNVALVTSNAVSIPATKGWYIDLTLNSGERVVNTPLLRSGALVVTSTQPSTSSCTAGGTSYGYFIDYANGSSFPTPQFSVTGGGPPGDGDMAGGKVPLGVQLGTGFYADATILSQGPPGGPPGPIGTCQVGDYQTYQCGATGTICTPRCLKGSNKRRIAWWEIKR